MQLLVQPVQLGPPVQGQLVIPVQLALRDLRGKADQQGLPDHPAPQAGQLAQRGILEILEVQDQPVIWVQLEILAQPVTKGILALVVLLVQLEIRGIRGLPVLPAIKGTLVKLAQPVLLVQLVLPEPVLLAQLEIQ